jgi:hypothetical protein
MVAPALRRVDGLRAGPIAVPAALLALPALPLARLLPAEGAGLYLRLATATLVVLLPGILVARALRRPGAAASLSFALALVFGALALTFALDRSLVTAAVALAVAGVGALPLALRRPPPSTERRDRPWLLVLAAGTVFGWALWLVARPPGGDALFHLARMRKLAAFDELSLGAVGEFADGGLHPGYAFPLWHGFLALVALVGGVDVADVVRHQASVLAPLAFLLVFEAGAVLFASAGLGAAVLAAHVGLRSLAPDHGGAFAHLALPATASALLLVPAVLALTFAYVREPSRALLGAIACASLALTLVHSTYTLFVALPLAGFLVVRALVARGDARRLAAALAALLVPAAAVIAWLLPIVRETASHRPAEGELERALARYADQLQIAADGAYRLAPEVVARAGAVPVAALALVPLAALALRRERWAAFVLGGALAVLTVVLVPELFMRVSDAVSLSQSRRIAGFLPFTFALAGGIGVLARLLGPVVLPVALVAGIGLQLAYPGDFTTRLDHGGGPALLAWLALAGGAAALGAALVVRQRSLEARTGALPLLATALFVAPIGVQGLGAWTAPDRPEPLTPGLVAALRQQVPEQSVVFSDLETSYRIPAFAPVYVAAAPPAHVADTEANRPYERRRDVIRFFAQGDLEIPRGYGAEWLVVDARRFDVEPDLEPAYEDDRYRLYRLRR